MANIYFQLGPDFGAFNYQNGMSVLLQFYLCNQKLLLYCLVYLSCKLISQPIYIFTFSGSLLRLNLNFCFLDDPDPDDGFNYKQMMVRDERRFKMADKDGDLIATKEEFTAFLHPEEYDYMKDIVVQVGQSKGAQRKCRFSLSCLCCLSSLAFPLYLDK